MEQGSYEEVLKMDPLLQKEVAEETEKLHKSEEEQKTETETEKPLANGKLITQEEISEGLVSWAACEFFLHSGLSNRQRSCHHSQGLSYGSRRGTPCLFLLELCGRLHFERMLRVSANVVSWFLGVSI